MLAQTSLLPPGARTRDVGAFRALEVMVRAPGEYWATTDVIDAEGSGHLEVTIAGATAGSPPTLAELQQYHELYPGTTGAEHSRPDGSLFTTSITTTSDGLILQRAILARPDGTYVDVRSSNEDSRTGGRTRPTPPVEAATVLDTIIEFRP